MNSQVVIVEDAESGESWEVEVWYRDESYVYGSDADGNRGIRVTEREIVDLDYDPRMPKRLERQAIALAKEESYYG